MPRIRRYVALLLPMLAASCKVVPPPAPPPPPPAEPPRAEAPVAKAPAAKAPAAIAPVAKPATPKPATPKPATPTLDLKSLEQRLKDTNAIGVLTKLSLKNQVDDLVEQFQAFHHGHRPPTLAELRRPFELLLMKVLSVLQDGDPALAREIDASREAIWGVLSDRDKLSKYL